MKICILAYNSVVSDARILKEADSLAKARHDVTVYGLRDNRADADDFVRESGAKIVLVDPRGELQKLARYSKIITGIAPDIIREICLFAYAAIGVFILAYSPELLIIPVDIFKEAIYFVKEVPKLPFLIRDNFHYAFSLSFLLLLTWRFLVYWPKIKKQLKRHWNVSSGNGARKQALSLQSLRAQFLVYLGNRVKIRMLARAACQHAPDVVHCHDLMTLPAGVAACRATRAKLVWDAHEIYEEIAQGTEAQRRKYRRMLRTYQHHVNSFITINDSIAEFYRTTYPALPPATIIKNATVPIPPVEYDGRLHRAAELPPEQKIVLYQGGFASKRGLRALVSAARHLKPDWTLVMMGWGRIEADLHAIAEEVLVATPERAVLAVRFLPPAPQAELAHWTAGATVGVIPYERVGLNHLYCTPNKLWEYPSAGVPFLCSPLVEMSKVVETHGVGWFLPDPATPEGIADAVNTLSDEAMARAKAACVTYIGIDNWTMYESRLISLYAGLFPERRDVGQSPVSHREAVMLPVQTGLQTPAS